MIFIIKTFLLIFKKIEQQKKYQMVNILKYLYYIYFNLLKQDNKLLQINLKCYNISEIKFISNKNVKSKNHISEF